MNKVFCVFKVTNDTEPILWKVFDNRDTAIKWIEKYGSKEQFVWEQWSVHNESHISMSI